MNEAVAAWASAHALLLFIGLPLASGAAALGIMQRYSAGAPRRRKWMLAVGVSGLILVFAVLAGAVRRQGGVVAFDGALANALSMSMDASLLWALSWFTYLGDRNFLIVLSVAMTLYLIAAGWWRLALFCAVATGLNGGLNVLLKHTFERLRPVHDHGFASAAGWSFPSGHASAAMAVYGTACYLIWCLAPSAWRRPAVAVTVALIMAIGLSRILLQVHFASDVMAGFAVSLAWMALCVAAVERWWPSRRAEQEPQ